MSNLGLASGRRLRRSSDLVGYWAESHLTLRSLSTDVERRATTRVLAILDAGSDWVEESLLLDTQTDRQAATELVDELLRGGFLVVDGDRGRRRGMRSWGRWNPAAGFFHRATRDVPFEAPKFGKGRLHIIGAERPPALKAATPGSETVELGAPSRSGEFLRTCGARRTWRRFGSERMGRSELSTLLANVWGVQLWATDAEGYRLALKTSPSGGARHSIEAYVVVLNVAGVPEGTYHYQPDANSLARVSGPVSEAEFVRWLPHQEYWRHASVVVFMTSVVARVQARYSSPRAYRVIQIEAGHLGQTFLLTAASLGLAPFSTAALGDSAIEEHLGLDAAVEPVLYCCGAGTRPPGIEWAPWPIGDAVPSTTLPRYRRRDGDQPE